MCWSDLDLPGAQLSISRSRTAAGYQVFEGAPKTPAARRTIALDKHTVKVLRTHLRRWRTEQARQDHGGDPRQEQGYVFTAPDSAALHPDYITRRFARLLATTGLPPIRLHDLRHGAACLAHAAGADLKTVQHQLGHASISITADLYTTVLPATQRHSAKATAKLLLNAAKRRPDRRGRKQRNQ